MFLIALNALSKINGFGPGYSNSILCSYNVTSPFRLLVVYYKISEISGNA